MRTSLVSLSLLSTALLAACSDDIPPPKDVRAAIADDLHNVLTEGKAAMDGSTANLPTGAAFGFATTAVGTVSPRLAAPLSNLLHAKDRTTNATGDDIDPDAIIQTLNEKLFTDANYLGDGVYKVPPELVCDDGDVDCAQHVTDAQLRVRVAESHMEEFQAAAARAGISLSAWVTERLLKYARQESRQEIRHD
jgi:hypothetical protein